jgi:hypothetical protein
MQAAIALDTRNPLARFELANVLMAQERLEEALQQLQELAVSARLKRCNTWHPRVPDPVLCSGWQRCTWSLQPNSCWWPVYCKIHESCCGINTGDMQLIS